MRKIIIKQEREISLSGEKTEAYLAQFKFLYVWAMLQYDLRIKVGIFAALVANQMCHLSKHVHNELKYIHSARMAESASP